MIATNRSDLFDGPRLARRHTLHRPILVALLLLPFVGCGGSDQSPSGGGGVGGNPPPSSFKLVWHDEFNGAAGSRIDPANWLYDIGTSYPGGPPNWGTGEVESMTDDPANISLDGNGHLAITPIRGVDSGWTSGRIETQRSDFEPPAGGAVAFEASIRQPNVSGDAAAGYWPAFWSLGAAFRGNYQNWPGIGEIDVLEDVNGRSSEFGTVHCGTVDPPNPCNEFTGLGSGEVPCPGCQTAFHKYRIELDYSTDPEEIRWYLDGDTFFTLRADAVDRTTWTNATHHGFFLILNVSMGGGFPGAFGGGPTDATVSGIPMLVDYVRVYERH
jgi:beta-glucanase (GH16 family)